MATMTLDDLVSQLRAAYGGALRAVVLYGSAAAGEHVPKRSDYNVLVIVDELGMPQLRAAAATARAWGEAGNPPPLTLTTAEWRGSADVFPMEYADILERHRVLHGEPPFAGLRVDPVHLRLELEQQALGKLLKLRASVMATGGDAGRQLALLEASLSTFMVIFRALARLHGERPPADYEALTASTARVAGIDGAPFQRVIRHRRGTEPLRAGDAADVLGGMLRSLEGLVAHLDRFHGHGAAPADG